MIKFAQFRFEAGKESPFKAGTILADIHDMMTALAAKRANGFVNKWEAQRLVKAAKEHGVVTSKRSSDAILEDYLRQTTKSGIVVPVRGGR